MRTSIIPSGYLTLKTIGLAATLLVCFMSQQASATNTTYPASHLKITISGIKKATGSIRVAVFENKENWLNKATYSAVLPVKDKQAFFSKDAIPFGTYGVAIFHDVNDNGEMDRNFIGLPKEPYGFSNNAKGSFGPAKWKKAKVTIADPQTNLTIRIK